MKLLNFVDCLFSVTLCRRSLDAHPILSCTTRAILFNRSQGLFYILVIDYGTLNLSTRLTWLETTFFFFLANMNNVREYPCYFFYIYVFFCLNITIPPPPSCFLKLNDPDTPLEMTKILCMVLSSALSPVAVCPYVKVTIYMLQWTNNSVDRKKGRENRVVMLSCCCCSKSTISTTFHQQSGTRTDILCDHIPLTNANCPSEEIYVSCQAVAGDSAAGELLTRVFNTDR